MKDSPHTFTWLCRCLICLSLAALGSLGLPGPAHSQTPLTRVQVLPVNNQVPLCAESLVTVHIQDVTGLVGYSLQLAFPPGSFEVLEVTDGGFLESGFYEPSNGFDNAAGVIRFGMVQVNPSLPKDGGGDLIHIRVRGSKPAVNLPILIDPVSSALVGADYLPIPFTIENGVIATYSCQVYLPSIFSPTGRDR